MKKSTLILSVFATFAAILLGSQYSYGQEAEQKKQQYSILEKGEKEERSPVPFLPIFTEDGTVYGITDSIGNITLEEGITFFIRSLFYQDKAFRVEPNAEKVILLERAEIALEEIEIRSFQNPIDQLIHLNKSFEPAFEKEAFLSNFRGYYAVQQQEKYVDFFEASGISLHSKSQKWKPYNFVQAWGGGSAHQFLVPLELRRSHHWDWTTGDTIPARNTLASTERSDQYFIKPFYARELMHAFEYSWPLSSSNLKFYDFQYDLENGKEIILFKSKDEERVKANSDLFLIGEGKIILGESGENIENITINFSKYNYVAFPKNRNGRERQMGGSLSVIFENSSDKVFVSEVELKAKLFGPINIGNPRPYRKGSEVTIMEKILFEDFQFIQSKKDLASLEKGFGFVGLETMVVYDPEYWNSHALVSPDLFNQIRRDLGSKISLNDQFEANSGKRLIPEEKDLAYYKDYISKLIPQLESIAREISED
ncbi:hypothetical protein SAMN04488104_10544 [Algoriphagus faecimaris]|uniref:YARHG domain-containing protein n=1 Tax=Algoriphagus faecimaris TaxID=686796 RepID=A0A1G6XA97_9BACT|nr:hypothetical protein [Algoriphagus faecimaris]SDD75110.1 hypothetical protein SAMN04488104_10544 [Algoriphagus faecimaris]